MTTSEQIRVLCVRSGVSLSELARRINQTPQNFSVKLKRNTVTQDELNQIANVLNVKYEQSNICKDPITLQTRHCFGLLLTTSNHLSY